MLCVVERNFTPKPNADADSWNLPYRAKACCLGVAQLVTGMVDSLLFFPVTLAVAPYYALTGSGHQWSYLNDLRYALQDTAANVFVTFLKALNPDSEIHHPLNRVPYFCETMVVDNCDKIDWLSEKGSNFFQREIASRVWAAFTTVFAPLAVASDLATIPVRLAATLVSLGKDNYFNNNTRNTLYFTAYLTYLLRPAIQIVYPYKTNVFTDEEESDEVLEDTLSASQQIVEPVGC